MESLLPALSDHKLQHFSGNSLSPVILVQIKFADIHLIGILRVISHKADSFSVSETYQIIPVSILQLLFDRRHRLKHLYHIVILFAPQQRIVMFLHDRGGKGGQFPDLLLILQRYRYKEE